MTNSASAVSVSSLLPASLQFQDLAVPQLEEGVKKLRLRPAIALEHLILEGTLDRFPGLKICAAHGGGYLPSYAPRMDHACRVNPAECNPNIVLKKKPTEYLRSLYFDTLIFTPNALRHLIAEVGASQHDGT